MRNGSTVLASLCTVAGMPIEANCLANAQTGFIGRQTGGHRSK